MDRVMSKRTRASIRAGNKGRSLRPRAARSVETVKASEELIEPSPDSFADTFPGFSSVKAGEERVADAPESLRSEPADSAKPVAIAKTVPASSIEQPSAEISALEAEVAAKPVAEPAPLALLVGLPRLADEL